MIEEGIPIGDIKAPGKWEKPARRPTGQELFDAMTHEEQDAQFGAEVAQRLRDGDLKLSDLVARRQPGDTPGFIVAKPAQDLPD